MHTKCKVDERTIETSEQQVSARLIVTLNAEVDVFRFAQTNVRLIVRLIVNRISARAERGV